MQPRFPFGGFCLPVREEPQVMAIADSTIVATISR